MLLKYTKPNTLTLHIPIENSSKTKPYTMLPGISEIEDSVWKELKKQVGVKRLMTKGDLVEHAPPTKDNKKTGKGLAKYGADEAKFIIAETFDKALLTQWMEIEGRVAVKTAIEAQLKLVEESVTKIEDKDEDEE